MNSHERRVVERYWRHAINVYHDDDRYNDIVAWLNLNFGSCNFKRRHMPRWCWRPHYESIGNFSQMWTGDQLYFRKDRDYTAFLLRWDGA